MKAILIADDIEGQLTCFTGKKFRGDTICTLKEGKLHSEDDQPSVISENCKLWHKHGELHRMNGPAVENINGRKEWIQNGVYHNKDGPAVINPDGTKEWRQDGSLFREGDLPAIEKSNGYKAWYKNNSIHREGGPAVIDSNGREFWYYYGQLHRLDGPAIDSKKLSERQWFVHGLGGISEYQFNYFTLSLSFPKDNCFMQVKFLTEVPENYTGVVEFQRRIKLLYVNGKVITCDTYPGISNDR